MKCPTHLLILEANFPFKRNIILVNNYIGNKFSY